mgnify:FL=1
MAKWEISVKEKDIVYSLWKHRAAFISGRRLATACEYIESASILSSKVELLVQMIPALGKEIEWDTRGKNTKTVVSKDKVSYQFKNGSVIENLAATESSRGQRYTSGIIEECAKIDGKILNAVVIPTMAVDRNINGQVDKNEKINRRQLYMNFFL